MFDNKLNAESAMERIKNKCKEDKKALKVVINSILTSCLNSIKMAAEINESDIIFEVPFATTSCIYKPSIAIEKIKEELDKHDFDTYIVNDYTLYISWAHIKKIS